MYLFLFSWIQTFSYFSWLAATTFKVQGGFKTTWNPALRGLLFCLKQLAPLFRRQMKSTIQRLSPRVKHRFCEEAKGVRWCHRIATSHANVPCPSSHFKLLQASGQWKPSWFVRESSSCCRRLRTHRLWDQKNWYNRRIYSSTQVKSLLSCFLLCFLLMTCSHALRLVGFFVWCAAMLPLLVVHVQLASWVDWEILGWGRQVVHSCSDGLLTLLHIFTLLGYACGIAKVVWRTILCNSALVAELLPGSNLLFEPRGPNAPGPCWCYFWKARGKHCTGACLTRMARSACGICRTWDLYGFQKFRAWPFGLREPRVIWRRKLLRERERGRLCDQCAYVRIHTVTVHVYIYNYIYIYTFVSVRVYVIMYIRNHIYVCVIMCMCIIGVYVRVIIWRSWLLLWISSTCWVFRLALLVKWQVTIFRYF